MEAQEPSEWIVSMRQKLKKAQEYVADQPWEKWSIYRAPRRLREAQDINVYVPQTVSIGPYHHGDERVQSMDRHKWIALHRILERTGKDLNMYLDCIREVEIQARGCYEQELGHLSSNQFVEMMVLDGCFILQLLHCSPKVENRHNMSVAVIFNLGMIEGILFDMVMLENQIPLFILDRLLGLIYTAVGNPNDLQKPQATDLALTVFNPEWLTGAPLSKIQLEELKSSLLNGECLHVLDVFRRSLLHRGPQSIPLYRHRFRWRICDKILPGYLEKCLQINRVPNGDQGHRQVIHTVTELREAGVKFRKQSTNCFWDIKFKKGVLEIPSIRIHDGTMSILLNLAAYEQCHLHFSDAVIASYAFFMECLLKSPEDVGYLHRHGIIQHLLGHDGEVVDMFKSVSKEMVFDAYGGQYAKLAEEVNAYYNKRRNRWRASLKHKYLNNPWAIISLAAALILLLLTATQTIYAVYSFYYPTS